MLPPTERASIIQLVRLDVLYGLLFSPERDNPARVVGYSLVLPDVGLVFCARLVTYPDRHVFQSCINIHQLVYRDPFGS